MSRLRIRFKRGEEVKFISHLDTIRLWLRAFRRAGIELEYSEGFTPHPRVSLAAPLAIGITSEAELMDIYTTGSISPHIFSDMVSKQMPKGMEILNTFQVSPNLPALQAQIIFAEYMVSVEVKEGEGRLTQVLTNMLAEKQFPWQHRRDTGIKSYDLRPLIDDLWLDSFRDNIAWIGMRLTCDNRGSGRPEQVIRALGLCDPLSIHRSKLILKTS
ncbi:MAG: TIGR03936 family radical SAM-associated protein [Dehalococcoidales bacterium]|nr:TIGR03936 family radical SAM-associated protein [Dehalococcoidales bacterium]